MVRKIWFSIGHEKELELLSNQEANVDIFE